MLHSLINKVFSLCVTGFKPFKIKDVTWSMFLQYHTCHNEKTTKQSNRIQNFLNVPTFTQANPKQVKSRIRPITTSQPLLIIQLLENCKGLLIISSCTF